MSCASSRRWVIPLIASSPDTRTRANHRVQHISAMQMLDLQYWLLTTSTVQRYVSLSLSLSLRTHRFRVTDRLLLTSHALRGCNIECRRGVVTLKRNGDLFMSHDPCSKVERLAGLTLNSPYNYTLCTNTKNNGGETDSLPHFSSSPSVTHSLTLSLSLSLSLSSTLLV
jgi:hypothetical protein